MTTLVNVTTTQFVLSWTGFHNPSGYTSSNLGGLFSDEQSINEYLDQKVSEGWTIILVSVKEIK
jgi:hypothetical protein